MSAVLSSIPSTARWKLARDKADELTAAFSTPPIPVVEIANSRGVQVVLAEFNAYKDRVAGFCDFTAAKLFVNKDDIQTRQAFTIAHELGHWVLHRDIFLQQPDKYPILPRFQDTSANNPLEQEANCFAANLLVPAHLLKPVSGAPVSVLAAIFRVSKIMMEYRLKNV